MRSFKNYISTGAAIAICLLTTLQSKAELGFAAELHNQVLESSYQQKLYIGIDPIYWNWIQASNEECELSLTFHIRIYDEIGTVHFEAKFTKHIYSLENECNGLTLNKQFQIVKEVICAAGNYSLDVRIKDQGGATAQSVQQIIIRAPKNNDITLSDIMYGYNDSLQKNTIWIGTSLPVSAEELMLSLQFKLYKQKNYRIRAVLFQQENKIADELADRYKSVYQQTQLISQNNSTQNINFCIKLNNLKSGDYLLEVFLMDENGIVAERSKSMKIPRREQYAYYKHFINSPFRFKPIYPNFRWIEIDRSQNKEKAIESLHSDFWVPRDPSYDENIVERYEQRMREADSLFVEEYLVGCETNRGITYLAIGAPTVQRQLSYRNSNYLIWDYTYLNKSIVFCKKENNWLRINWY